MNPEQEWQAQAKRVEDSMRQFDEDLRYLNCLKGARDLCRSPDLMKKQCVVGSTQLQNRCLLRHRLFHLPAAYPRIDLASLIQTDPQCFWITGRLSSVYHRCHLLHRGLDTSSASP